MDKTSKSIDIIHIILGSDFIVLSVLLSLVVFSIFSWAIIFRKRKTYKDAKENNKLFLDVFTNTQSLRDVRMKADALPFGPFKLMFIEAFEEVEKLQELQGDDYKNFLDQFGLGGVERSLQKGANEANLILDNLLTVLASIGSISPFIGLFGTVWGIINSFKGLSSGGGSIEMVAPGIAEALVATAVGLFAAIPAVWFFNYFTSENTKLNTLMESFGQSFLNRAERDLIKK